MWTGKERTERPYATLEQRDRKGQGDKNRLSDMTSKRTEGTEGKGGRKRETGEKK